MGNSGRAPSGQALAVPATPAGAVDGPSGFDPSRLPTAICGYPLPGWRLDQVTWDVRSGEPDGWIVALKREHPNWQDNRREYVVMARSDVGPLEAWDEALRIAVRSDAREAKRAIAIEARSDATGTGAAEGESAGREASPNTPQDHTKGKGLS